MGKQSFGIDPERLGDYARQIKEVHDMGVQIGIVIGGGNIFRGLSGASKGFDRVKGRPDGHVCHRHQFVGPEFGIGRLGCEDQSADSHPHGTDRRVLQQMEGY